MPPPGQPGPAGHQEVDVSLCFPAPGAAAGPGGRAGPAQLSGSSCGWQGGVAAAARPAAQSAPGTTPLHLTCLNSELDTDGWTAAQTQAYSGAQH